jgi:hypothetical protein
MWQDPIVEEVRKLARNLQDARIMICILFFENLRKNQNKRNARVVSRIKDKTVCYGSSNETQPTKLEA